MKIVTLFEALGLGAALVGGLSVVRGEWSEAAWCLVALIVTSFLAALLGEGVRTPNPLTRRYR